MKHYCWKFYWRACGLVSLILLPWLAGLNVSAAPPPGYYLVWADEFNGTSLDFSKWWIWYGPDHQATDVPEAVSVGGGYLTITSFNTNSSYYTGTISSQGMSCYGYFEANIQWNGSDGMWSAFWINSPNTGVYDGNPSSSGAEVDICEHRNTDTGNVDNINNMVQQAVHWDNEAVDEKTAIIGPLGSGLGTGFHTYGLLWDRTNYTFNIDGTQTWSTNAGHSDRTAEVTLSSELTNGWYAGYIPTNGYGTLQTSTTTMVVDYVRYYAPTNTVFWTGVSSANWTDGGNWLSNMIPNAGSDLWFTHLSVGNFNTTLAQDTTVNSLAFQEGGPYSISGNTLTINSGGIDTVSAVANTTINSAVVLGAAQNWKIAQGLTLTVNGPVSGAGNLTLNWLGTVTLAGTNSCSSTTTISNGTLLVTGSMTNPVIAAGGTLSGTGTLSGPVGINANGTISPGPGIAKLTISNVLTFQSGGSASLDINKTAGTCDTIVGLTRVNYGGKLAINNLAGTLAAGDAFKLFDASSYSGAFASITPSAPGVGLGWNTNTLNTDGTLRVINVAASRTTNIVESRTGNITSGLNNPAFSYTGFSSLISATKSSAPGCSSPGSSRFSSTASSSPSFSVTPTLIPGTTYTVSVSWGFNTGANQESVNLVVKPTATGVSSTTFPATSAAFTSGPGDVTNNTWITVGNITPNVANPTITFTYASGLSSGRFYADAVRFVSQLPNPGAISFSHAGNQVVLNWPGNFTLQNATNAAGPYADLPGPIVVGPYTNTTSGNQQFFRLRQ